MYSPLLKRMDTPLSTEYYSHKLLLFGGFIFLGLLLLINEFATSYAIYVVYQGLDTPMHFVGGFGVGIVAIGLLRSWFTKRRYHATPQFWYTMVLVIAVGVVWEVAEAYYKVSVIFGGLFWFDTIKDLLMDTFGGILSYICFHPRISKNINQNQQL